MVITTKTNKNFKKSNNSESFSIFICLILTSIMGYSQNKIKLKTDSIFKLDYISLGLGSNMSEMQPMFRVKGYKFIYTSEQAWKYKNVKKARPDTLCMGNIRKSSIDSILIISREIKGNSVYKLNPGVMSGGIIYLDILNYNRKLKIELHNSYDQTANKIVTILNSYIPENCQKLWISDIIPTITEIK